MRNRYLLTTLFFLFFQLSIAQVGIGTTLPDTSSELDVSSPLNNKGVLIPRMTQAQRDLIATPATSLLIYQTDNSPGFYYYNGTIWVGIQAGTVNDWSLTGNSGTISATNFIGTTDDSDIVIKRNNIRAGFIGNPVSPTGSRNTSFGANSLLNPSATGIRNVAIGTNVLTNNGNGNLNVAIGESSMFTNTTGTNNTAVGAGSLFSSQLGVANTAIGRNALTTLNGVSGSQGSNNTAVGYEAIRQSTTGQQNTAVGREALRNNLTGDSNVAIGYQAGKDNTGSKNITIGSGAEVPVLANSDQLSIANVIYGTTMATTATGKIGIGESNPGSKLHVTSVGTDLNSIVNSYTPTTNTGFVRTGINNVVGGASNDNLTGQFNNVSGSGTGIHYGSSNQITSANSSYIYAHNNVVISDSNTMGNNNFITNNSALTTSNVVSYNSNLAGTSNGTIKGTDTTIGISGTGNHYGNYNLLTGTGNTVGGSNHYGNYNLLTGTGTTNKYGSYNRIDTPAGGTHYGVYSEVLKAGATNFAGYFLGNVGIGTTVANTYTLPVSRATTAGQIMQSNATGVVTWQTPATALNSHAWLTTGNSGISATTNFIGTTDSNAVVFRSNNIERMRINPVDGEIVTGALASPYAGDNFNGVATATLPFAVNGYTAQNGSGIWGETLAAGTSGFSSIQGVYGGTGVGSGVFGNYAGTNISNTRAGVQGIINSTSTATGGAAVLGNNQANSGNQHMGVLGLYNGAAFGIGVYGIGFGGGLITGNNDIAVVGWRANNVNYSGYFNGNHVIANGTKSASVGTSKGNQLLYVTETPEVWFEDIGGGQLQNGSVHISLDDMYLETIFVDETHPMRIFLQEEGESNGLIVIKDADNKGFTVKEKNGGTSNISFSYRIMAKRLHFQDHRFGNDPVWGAGDTRKYNQYAPPPPVDYETNKRFQEEQKKNYKPTPMPEGFIDYMTIQKQLSEVETKKTSKK